MNVAQTTVRPKIRCRRRHRVASSGRHVAPPWPGRMACFQRLAGTDPVLLRSWNVQRARGRPGRRLQSSPHHVNDRILSYIISICKKNCKVRKDLSSNVASRPYDPRSNLWLHRTDLVLICNLAWHQRMYRTTEFAWQLFQLGGHKYLCSQSHGGPL